MPTNFHGWYRGYVFRWFLGVYPQGREEITMSKRAKTLEEKFEDHFIKLLPDRETRLQKAMANIAEKSFMDANEKLDFIVKVKDKMPGLSDEQATKLAYELMGM